MFLPGTLSSIFFFFLIIYALVMLSILQLTGSVRFIHPTTSWTYTLRKSTSTTKSSYQNLNYSLPTYPWAWFGSLILSLRWWFLITQINDMIVPQTFPYKPYELDNQELPIWLLTQLFKCFHLTLPATPISQDLTIFLWTISTVY